MPRREEPTTGPNDLCVQSATIAETQIGGRGHRAGLHQGRDVASHKLRQKRRVQDWTRRGVLFVGVSGLNFENGSRTAVASKLGSAIDETWEKLGGGPADLTFPPDFLGKWQVQSTLVKVETPLGEDRAATTIQGYRRARSELNQTNTYAVMFVQNRRGQVILDRQFNTAEMLRGYYGDDVELRSRISWNRDDPNPLRVSLPGGMGVSTLVTRRSQRTLRDQRRLETSEFMRMVLDDAAAIDTARVVGSQCFTKYRWRSVEEAANGPVIVATQVVSEFPFPVSPSAAALPSFDPVVVYTYRLGFVKY